jgi:pimeloyl-ACP methyl ester carboxylesterase
MSRAEGPLEEAFRRAERVAWKHYGCAPSERMVHLERVGLDVRVLEFGKGEPILFVHGGGAVASSWTALWTGWSAGRVVALDRPGCGLSDPFSYRGVDLRRHAVDVLEGVLDALGLARVSIAANSMGGLWSFWLALDRPARVERMVQLGCPALILDTSAPLPMRLMSNHWLGPLLLNLERPTRANMRRLFVRMGQRNVAEEQLAAAAAAGALPHRAEAWLTLLGNVLSIGGKRVSLDEHDLGRVTQPVHFIWGSADPFGEVEVGRRACRVMPWASLEVIGTGHLPWLDEPERCRRAAEAFLARPSAVVGHA